MVPQFGILEIAIVLVIALIVFGPKRLPELGKSLGKGINEFRDGINSISKADDGHDEDDDPVEVDTEPAADPEVVEIEARDESDAESVDGEVVADRRD